VRASSGASDPRPSSGRGRIIAIANQKGGVGKSTTAVSLGAALADLGHRVLVVDLDPQGNASTGLGIKHEARDASIYDVLANDASVEDAVVETRVAGLSAVPSTIDLAGAEIELVSQFSRELRLRRALESVEDGSYDFVFLDCPPSLGLLTVNALAAAQELIVPIQCEYYALEGLGQLLHNVRLVQQNINPALRLTGIIMTMFDSRTKLSEQVVDEVRRYFGDRVYATIIPRTVRLSEAPGFGQPITEYDAKSRGAESYRALAKEVAERPIPEGEAMPEYTELPEVILPAAPSDAPEAEEPEAGPIEAEVPAPPSGEAPAHPSSGPVDPTGNTNDETAPPDNQPSTEGSAPANGRGSSEAAAAPPPASARPPEEEAAMSAHPARGPSMSQAADPVVRIPDSTSAPPSGSGRRTPQRRPRGDGTGARPSLGAPEGPALDVPLPTSAPSPPGSGETAPSRPRGGDGARRGKAGSDFTVTTEPDGRRIVVIDERAEEAAVQSGQERPRGRSSGSEAEIGEQLPQEQPRKRKWWQFGKGGGEA
jgi:chromosome partitioning protein